MHCKSGGHEMQEKVSCSTALFDGASLIHIIIKAVLMIFFNKSISLLIKESSVALVRERTARTERSPLVGEVSANFCGNRVSLGQRNESPRPYSRISRPEPLLFLPSSSSIVLTRLEWTPFLTHYF
jgi:hypothetical protein